MLNRHFWVEKYGHVWWSITAIKDFFLGPGKSNRLNDCNALLYEPKETYAPHSRVSIDVTTRKLTITFKQKPPKHRYLGKMFCTSLVSIVQQNLRYFFSCLVRVHLTRKNVCRLSTCQGTQMWHFEGRKNNNK